ncbi:MAG TPA: GIY-YIG nuclease family protein [candidate division Zixibacteria bacterium]|nr:GIY-YIG nuclease family protein [candidate division Zixibacteria bacterium]
MINSGIYQLLIELPEAETIAVGSLGEIFFAEGLYIYTGSAEKNLRERIARHFRKEKAFHWHIDYLLKYGEITAYSLQPYEPGLECSTNLDSLSSYRDAKSISGFGSSDCDCDSHLIFIGPG